MDTSHRSGFVAILGRPNVGKSTLLNALLGEKLAIVTPKPQTTRDRILGICPTPNGQLVFLDTPGVHRARKALNQHLRDVALATIPDADVILFVLDASRAVNRLGRDEEAIIRAIIAQKKPAIAVLNKIDQVQKLALLPLIKDLADRNCFQAIIPVSARDREGLEPLLAEARNLVPEGPPLFAEDELTDRPMRFLVGELFREQLMLSLADELPYSIAVVVTRYKARSDRPLVEIDCTVHVERTSQKGIVLGKGGERLKEVATSARAAIEALVGMQVYLRTHVRVEPGWTQSERAMRKLGYTPTDTKTKKKRKKKRPKR